MADNLPLYQRCTFDTKRLFINSVQSQLLDKESERIFALKVLELLSPKVTKSLPQEWQNIIDLEEAQNWLQQRLEESNFLSIKLKPNNEIIGFVLIYDDESQKNKADIHIGYLLGEAYWAKGYGSEFTSLTITISTDQSNVFLFTPIFH